MMEISTITNFEYIFLASGKHKLILIELANKLLNLYVEFQISIYSLLHWKTGNTAIIINIPRLFLVY